MPTRLKGILHTCDLGAVVAGWSLLAVGTGAGFVPQRNALLLVVAAGVGLTLLGLSLQRLYRTRVCMIRSVEVQRLARGVGGAAVGTAAVAYLLGASSFVPVAGAAAAVLTLLIIERSVFRSWVQQRRRRGELTRRVVLVGANDEALELKRSLDEHPEAGMQVCGFAASSADADRASALGVPWLGPVSAVPAALRTLRATGVLIVTGAVPPHEVDPLVRDLPAAGLHVHVSSGLHSIAGHRLRSLPLAYEPLMYVEPVGLRSWQALIKRAVDVTLGAVALVLAAPILLVAAAAIKLEDGGPVLFRQLRVGRANQAFSILKLRTMAVDAESRLDELIDSNQRLDGPLFKLADDPRITRCGRLLRRTSLDELPQLLNVLRGEMSLVGPRPALTTETERFDAALQRRAAVRPGVTGLWQIEARDNPAFGPYRRLDLYYVENWSVGLDLSILVSTVLVVLARSLPGSHGTLSASERLD